MQCPACELENEEGALYCARCHAALPRPPAPGECPYCGRQRQPGELSTAVCPSCGNDPERGKEIREKRLTALRAEVNQQASILESQRQALTSRPTRKGCGLTLLVIIVLIICLTPRPPSLAARSLLGKGVTQAGTLKRQPCSPSRGKRDSTAQNSILLSPTAWERALLLSERVGVQASGKRQARWRV
jgi:hypothetical protein